MANQSAAGFERFCNAFFNSIAGLKATWKHEEAFRLEVLLFLVSTPFALWLGESVIEQLLLIGSVVLILLFELLNSAIEAVVDRIGLEHHELSGRAKDIGSTVVMLAMIWAAIVWVFILF